LKNNYVAKFYRKKIIHMKDKKKFSDPTVFNE